MNSSSTNRVLIALCIVLSIVSVSAVGYAIVSDESDADYDTVRYTMFFGMADRSDDEISAIEERVKTLITDTGNGYTVLHASGGYVSDGHVFTDPVSLQFIVVGADPEDIAHVVESYQSEFGGGAVYVEQEPVKSGFM